MAGNPAARKLQARRAAQGLVPYGQTVPIPADTLTL